MNNIEELFLCKHQLTKIYIRTSYFVSLAICRPIVVISHATIVAYMTLQLGDTQYTSIHFLKFQTSLGWNKAKRITETSSQEEKRAALRRRG